MAVRPIDLARAYAAFARDDEHAALLAALRRRPLGPGAAGWAWKTGTSSGRRDAWCVGVGPGHVAVVWLGRLDNRRDDDLVGSGPARDLLWRVACALDGGGGGEGGMAAMADPDVSRPSTVSTIGLLASPLP